MKYPCIMKYVGKNPYRIGNLVVASKSLESSHINCFEFMGLRSWFSCDRKDLKPINNGKELKSVVAYLENEQKDLSKVSDAIGNSKKYGK